MESSEILAVGLSGSAGTTVFVAVSASAEPTPSKTAMTTQIRFMNHSCRCLNFLTEACSHQSCELCDTYRAFRTAAQQIEAFEICAALAVHRRHSVNRQKLAPYPVDCNLTG